MNTLVPQAQEWWRISNDRDNMLTQMTSIGVYADARESRPQTWLRATAHAFSDEHELRQLVRFRRLDAIVLRLGPTAVNAIIAVLAVHGGGAAVRCPLILDAFPSRLALDQIVGLSGAGLRLRVLLPGGARRLEAEVAELPASSILSPTEYLLPRVAPLISPQFVDVVLPSLIVGATRVSTTHFEATCRRSGRSIRDALRSHSLPTTSRLLALVLGFGVAYNTQINEMSLAQSAAAAGVSSETALRRYLKTKTGMPPSQWRSLGPDGALARLLVSLDRVLVHASRARCIDARRNDGS